MFFVAHLHAFINSSPINDLRVEGYHFLYTYIHIYTLRLFVYYYSTGDV